jgi:hypothetical protein
MKRLLTLTVVCAFAWTANAQTEKGKILLGGNIDYNHGKSESIYQFPQDQSVSLQNKNTFNSFSIGPNVGIFIKDNFAVGLGLTYSHGESNANGSQVNYQNGMPYLKYSTSTNKSDLFGINPYARYYVGLTDKFKFFGQLTAHLAKGTQKGLYSSLDTTSLKYQVTAIDFNFQPGLAFFPIKRLSIQLSTVVLNYSHMETKNKLNNDKSSENKFGFNADTLSPTLGLMFHL